METRADRLCETPVAKEVPARPAASSRQVEVLILPNLRPPEAKVDLAELFRPGCIQEGYVVDAQDLLSRLHKDGAVVLPTGYGGHFVLLERGAHPELEPRLAIPNAGPPSHDKP